MSLLKDTEQFVTDKLKGELDPNLVYHNLEHTVEVVGNCKHLSEKLNLPPQDKEELLLAAWLHDVGFTKSHINHEEESARIAREHLQGKVNDETTLRVCQLILSTKATVEPSSELEKILHDADTLNVGTDNFFSRSKLLKREMEFIVNKKFSDKEWIEIQLLFFASHDFKTQYCRNHYSAKRIENFQKLQS